MLGLMEMHWLLGNLPCIPNLLNSSSSDWGLTPVLLFVVQSLSPVLSDSVLSDSVLSDFL